MAIKIVHTVAMLCTHDFSLVQLLVSLDLRTFFFLFVLYALLTHTQPPQSTLSIPLHNTFWLICYYQSHSP